MIFKGTIKATETIEQERLQLWNDYQTYLKVEGSEKLKNYLACKEKVDSKTFQENKKQIESLRFKGSPEEKMVKEFQLLEKNSKLTTYFSVKESIDLDRFLTIKKSGLLSRLKELDEQVHSKSFVRNYKEFSGKKNPDDATKRELASLIEVKKEFDNLKTSDEVLFHNRFTSSKKYKVYTNIEGSSVLTQYTKLKQEIDSEKFVERKSYLEDKNRFEKTDDFKTLTTFKKLGEDQEIKLYLKYHETDAFHFFREWQSTFNEEFEGKLDHNKWSFVTPIAEKGPGRNFAIKNQLHCTRNDENFKLDSSILTLETTHHKAEGLYWDEQFGFIKKHFNYTSGLTHTLNSFKQEYGRFEVKLKASKVKGVISSVSLVDEDENICIRLFTTNGGNANGGLVTTDHMQKNFHPIKLNSPSRGYMIVTLDWTPEKLEWSLNGKVAGSITHNVPHLPLGIRIESEVIKETSNLPHRFDIDWIKCYKNKR